MKKITPTLGALKAADKLAMIAWTRSKNDLVWAANIIDREMSLSGKAKSRRKKKLSKGHTPGPWDCHTLLPESYKICPAGQNVSQFHTKSSDEFFANARLVAAAPELLEILVAFVERTKKRNGGAWTVGGDPLCIQALFDATHTLISKATS